MARHQSVLDAPPTAILEAVREGPPDLSPHNLGSAAIRMTAAGDLYDQNADFFQSIGDTELAETARMRAEAHYQKTTETLDAVRAKLRDVGNHELAEGYLQAFLLGEFERAQKEGAPHATIVDWLSDKQRGASNDVLHGFLSRHVARLSEEQQRPEFQQTVANLKALYTTRTQEAVADRRYSPYALETLPRVQKAGVLIGDFWDTYIVGDLGYHLDGKDYIIVSERPLDMEGQKEAMAKDVLHEFFHVQFSEASDSRWENEAGAEHNAVSMLYGNPGLVDPAERGDSKSYFFERTLERCLLQGGKYAISARVFSRAQTSAPGSSERETYERALEDSWGPGIKRWVNTRIRVHESSLRVAGKDEGTAEVEAVALAAKELTRGDFKPGRHRR